MRLRSAGFSVDGIPLSVNPPSHAMSWEEIDKLWKRGDRNLLSFYESVALKATEYDVFINCNGVNLHTEFVEQLPLLKVYACFDDPESSDWLSRPVAASYDLALVGNIACLDMYRGWGVKEVEWWPIGFHPHDCDPTLTRERILEEQRNVDLVLLCERISNWRDSRIETFTSAFPAGTYFGKGWPSGFLPECERVPLYQRSKMGPNFHNSIGPVNSRTFILPANGVMQLCDNQSHLGKIFELGKEVVGFDNVEDAIDLCRYYKAHDEERREIALAGWERVHRDYNEVAVFNIMVKRVNELMLKRHDLKMAARNPIERIVQQRNKTALRNFAHEVFSGIRRRLL